MAHHLVFVYGTLLQGQGNHRLMAGGHLFGSAETVDRFHMSADSIPFVSRRAEVCQVKGEAYLIDDEHLQALDRLEGHPGWYCRELVPVRIGSDPEPVNAWMYINERTQGRNTITDGDFAAYIDRKWAA